MLTMASIDDVRAECQLLRDLGGPVLALPPMLAASRLRHEPAGLEAIADVHGLPIEQVRALRQRADVMFAAARARPRPEPSGSVQPDEIAEAWGRAHDAVGITPRGLNARRRHGRLELSSRLIPPATKWQQSFFYFYPRIILRDPQLVGGRYDVRPENFADAAEWHSLALDRRRVRWFDGAWRFGHDAVEAWGRRVEDALRFALVLTESDCFTPARYVALLASIGTALDANRTPAGQEEP